MTMQFIVDTFIDYQFKYMAKAAFHGDALTAFFGRFYGRYLNITEIVLQLFFTTAIVRRLGVGGTLQVMPVSLAAASIFTFASPSVLSASLARLTEASTRYTLTRTANELFYMPLTPELRNRIKAFIDIFVDRAARGIAGFALLAFAALNFGVRGVAVVTIVITVPWILLTVFAHRQYVKTIRGRIEARRLDVESARVRVEDRDTVRMLENTAAGENPRQAAYALQLLDQAEGYNIRPLLARLAASPLEDVRAKVYEHRGAPHHARLFEPGTRIAPRSTHRAAAREAARYVVSVSANNAALAREWLDSGHSDIQEGVIEALADQPDLAAEIVPSSWINDHAASEDWRQRALAARVLAGRGDRGLETLYHLLADPDPRVASAACRAAAALKNREYVLPVAKLLADYRVRGDAIEALASYGPVIVGTLGDLIDDDSLPVAVRSSIPRVLRRIQHQRSVDVLMAASRADDPAVRGAALKALSRLRESCPTLNYEDPLLTQRILNEAHHYHELVGRRRSIRRRLAPPSHCRVAACPYARGADASKHGAAVPATRLEVSCQRNVLVLPVTRQKRQRTAFARDRVSGQCSRSGREADSAADLGVAGTRRRAWTFPVRHRAAGCRKHHPQPAGLRRPLAGRLCDGRGSRAEAASESPPISVRRRRAPHPTSARSPTTLSPSSLNWRRGEASATRWTARADHLEVAAVHVLNAGDRAGLKQPSVVSYWRSTFVDLSVTQMVWSAGYGARKPWGTKSRSGLECVPAVKVVLTKRPGER